MAYGRLLASTFIITIQNNMEQKTQFKQVLMMLLIGICLYSLDYLININVQLLKNEDFASVNGTVNTIKKERYHTSYLYDFTLKEYPNTLFRVDFVYQGLMENRLETMPIDSSTHLNISILKDIYDLKIAKPPKRDRRIFNRKLPYIEVCELVNPSNNFVYLSLDEYKTYYGTSFGRFSSFVGFAFMFFGVLDILKLVFSWLRRVIG